MPGQTHSLPEMVDAGAQELGTQPSPTQGPGAPGVGLSSLLPLPFAPGVSPRGPPHFLTLSGPS